MYNNNVMSPFRNIDVFILTLYDRSLPPSKHKQLVLGDIIKIHKTCRQSKIHASCNAII